MRDKSISTAERRFVSSCVAEENRIDGRRLTEARRVSISVGPTWGFTEVSFDKTLAIASTTVEAVTPSTDRPSEGILNLSMDLSPTSSEPSARDALQRPGPNPAVTETRNSIDNFIRDARALDTEALCILSGVKVWSVRVHVDLINDDGNVADACILAIMASLMHARRPEVSVTGRDVRVYPVDEREPVPLPVHHVPLAVSFALFGPGKPYEPDVVVLDPVKKEELAAGGALSFAYNAQGEVCGVYKAGGLPLSPDTFLQCSEVAAVRARKLTVMLKRALADAAAQHPLATLRPMLVNPEPVAQLAKKGAARRPMEGQGVSMWNATPMEDDAPPPTLPDNQPVKLTEIVKEEDVDETVESIFGGRDESRVPKEEVKESDESAKKKAIVEQIVISDDEESSSDEDLMSAINHRPKGKRR